jgi:hypothetical protein
MSKNIHELIKSEIGLDKTQFLQIINTKIRLKKYAAMSKRRRKHYDKCIRLYSAVLLVRSGIVEQLRRNYPDRIHRSKVSAADIKKKILDYLDQFNTNSIFINPLEIEVEILPDTRRIFASGQAFRLLSEFSGNVL